MEIEFPCARSSCSSVMFEEVPLGHHHTIFHFKQNSHTKCKLWRLFPARSEHYKCVLWECNSCSRVIFGVLPFTHQKSFLRGTAFWIAQPFSARLAQEVPAWLASLSSGGTWLCFHDIVRAVRTCSGPGTRWDSRSFHKTASPCS